MPVDEVQRKTSDQRHSEDCVTAPPINQIVSSARIVSDQSVAHAHLFEFASGSTRLLFS